VRQPWHSFVSQAAAAWPFHVDEAEFIGYATERLPDGDPGRVSDLRGADLYLAFACARGLPEALECFDTRVLPKVAKAVERLAPVAGGEDELLQRLRQRLLLPRGDRPPRIADYSGVGSLDNWTRAVAIRLGLRLKSRARPEEQLDEDLHLERLVAPDDPELDFVRSRYRSELTAAFRAAFEALPPRDRNLVKLHLLDGLSIDRLGVMHQVHRSTAARWVNQAREQLLDGTRQWLSEKCRLTRSELDSLIFALQSNIGHSLARILRDASP
jgi:RNA polymerase sigma-70 factor (ECF subfamily)